MPTPVHHLMPTSPWAQSRLVLGPELNPGARAAPSTSSRAEPRPEVRGGVDPGAPGPDPSGAPTGAKQLSRFRGSREAPRRASSPPWAPG